MSDPHIDNGETLSYGDFAAAQILSLIIGLDPDFDTAVTIAATRITAATTAMRAALGAAGDVNVVTYQPAKGAADPVDEARQLVRRVVSYADSRPNGDTIASDLLDGENQSTVLRRRPAKLAGALTHAIGALAKHKAALPEFDAWTERLTVARDALAALNTAVRSTRTERRDATPAVVAAREAWFTSYSGGKLIVEGVLRYHGKTKLMSEVFDDLAEVHRAPGVTDDAAPPKDEVAKPA